MGRPWESDFFPQALWELMQNLGLLVAIVAVISAVGYLWKHGPQLLKKYGFIWMTKLGHRWQARRD